MPLLQTETPVATYKERIATLQAAMTKANCKAIVLESGPAMSYLTGVRWGKSERTFAVVVPAKGDLVWVLPGFEEARARELIHIGDDIRVWQEDESPYERIVKAIYDRTDGLAWAAKASIAIDDGARFFVFDGIRKLEPKTAYTGAAAVLKQGGVDTSAPAAARGRGGRNP
jgi:Xaa-Pro dipeptidase